MTFGFAFSSAIVGCSDRDVSMVTGMTDTPPTDTNQTALDHCIPGQTFQCMGACGAPSTGYQVCAADGRSLGPCICPPFRTLGPILPNPDRDDGGRHILPREGLVGSLPIASSTGSDPSFGSSGGASVEAIVVGAACRSDADCGTGLGCITAAGRELAGSGPAGGYCSAACRSDAACQSLDPASQCIGLAGQNVCARTCESRAPKAGVSKCLGRTDLMCVSVAARRQEPPGAGPQPGLCVPACQSDAQCGPGLFCNLASGLCDSVRPSGDPLGSPCTGPDSCAGGVCLPLNGFESVCSAFCRFGGPGCGFDASAAQPGAVCAFTQVPDEAVGDRGLCLALCQTALDCHETGAICIPTAQGSDTRTCVVPVAQEPAPGTGVPIGKACSEDADCAGGVCLSSETDALGLGGGFPGGYCSAPCTGSCTAGAVCVGTSDDNQHCMKACTPGAVADCADRPEFVCNPLRQGGFCRADCQLGGDCGDRVCNPSNGLCAEAPPGTGPTEPPPELVVGDACASNDDCGSGLTCLTASDDPFGFGGGFAGGYCTAPCTDSCAPGAVCAGPEGASLCLRQCSPAPAGDGDCGDRPELTCTAFQNNPTQGYCLPDCALGGDCGSRVCAPELDGVCIDEPVPECAQDEDCSSGQVCQAGSCIAASPPISVGAACAANSDCAGGLCLTLAGSRFCSALCVWDTAQGCESYGSDAFCVLPLSSAPDETRGVCTELCNTAADCAQAGYECADIGVTISGRTGTCLPPAPAPPAPTPPAAPAAPPDQSP